MEHGTMEHGRHDSATEHGSAHTAQGHGHGHGDHADHAAQFRSRFWLSLVLTIPIVAFSEMVQEWFGFRPPTFPGDDLVAPVLGTALFLYGGWPFLTGAVQEARSRQPGMMLLIGLAISVAFGSSAATALGLFDLEFWWELSLLITIMLLGHWLEMRATGQAQGALAALAELLPDDAERVRDGSVETVPIGALRVGDLVLVRSGARVPADGRIVEGEAEIDESMVTGESRPVAKSPDDEVVAGTVATDSAIRVEVTAGGEDTALAGIQRLVAEAQASRSRAQVLADRAAAFLFYVAVSAGAATLVTWSLLGDADAAVIRSVTVLVIACPHALGLAIPLVISISTSMSARNGILVKDRLALERMREVDVVLFDKTGTLTAGRHAVADVASADGDEGAVLRLAAAAEADSEHPLAKATVEAASARGGVPRAEGFRSLTGRGVEATVDGAPVLVGGPNLLRERGLDIPEALGPRVKEWSSRGAAVLTVVRDGAVVGAVALEDQIRPESREAVAELQERGKRVAMVGDGVNDAPALARADVGIAIGAGTDVAIESAGVVLASDDPRAVLDVIRLSKATYRKMVQNLVWATGYNAFAIPLAAGVLAWAGITLAPAVGAILMSLSTIVVALNAQLLRRLELGRKEIATT